MKPERFHQLLAGVHVLAALLFVQLRPLSREDLLPWAAGCVMLAAAHVTRGRALRAR